MRLVVLTVGIGDVADAESELDGDRSDVNGTTYEVGRVLRFR